jgi:hypothetical protein
MTETALWGFSSQDIADGNLCQMKNGLANSSGEMTGW